MGVVGGAAYGLHQQGVFAAAPDTGRIYSQLADLVPKECKDVTDEVAACFQIKILQTFY